MWYIRNKRYGRAIWACVKVFMDKRSQDKVLLYPGKDDSKIPKEILEFIDLDDIPVCVGGTNTEPLIDMMSTFY